jgi:hypothetical protein
MMRTELITTAVMLLAHVWVWRQVSTRSDRLAVLLSAVLSMSSPWWGTQETIRATPWMPGGFRAAATAVGTLWAFIVGAAVLMIIVPRTLRGRAPGRRAFFTAMAAPAVVIGYGAFIERTRYRVKEVDFPIRDLHKDLEGLRIVQISDLHAGYFLSVKEVARVIDMANELNPALSLFTGDLITQPGDPLDAAIAQVARLRADAGVLGCHGNHEIYAQCEDYATAIAARQGVTFLRSANKQLKWGAGTLNIAGVDYQKLRPRNLYIPRAESLLVPGSTSLLLSHNPDVFPASVDKGFDAMLAGHTHGGQVTVEILQKTMNPARFKTPFVSGLYRIDGSSCYVTNGVGTIGMPVRIGAPPEVVLLTLKRG